MLRSILVWSGVVYAGCAVASPHHLTSDLLRQELVGALIQIDTPLGVTVPVRISSDGLVSGEAGPLASTLGSAKDRGRWWIDQDRFCVKWFRWFEAETRCLTMEADGPKVFWRDTSGKSGTATIVKHDNATVPRPQQKPAALLTLQQEEATRLDPAPMPLKVPVPQPATRPPARTDDADRKTESGGGQTYDVIRVAVGGFLVIRSGPSEDEPQVGTISSKAQGLRWTGQCQDMWCPIEYRGAAGWVNVRSLQGNIEFGKEGGG